MDPVPPPPAAVLVTGAQRGIGRAIAIALARRGVDVAVLDRDMTGQLEDVARVIETLGRRSVAIACDIARIECHAAALDEAQSALGPLDGLVNNAGVSAMVRGDLLDVTPESFDRCLNVNTRATFFLTQSFARRAVSRTSARRRVIVTITSSNAVAASIARGEYCVSKAGLSMASTLFAIRLAGEGIEVYEIQPGLIETEMTLPSKARYDGMVQDGSLAIQRWGLPEDVAGVTATLVCDGLPYTVGQPIRVDGGMLIRKY